MTALEVLAVEDRLAVADLYSQWNRAVDAADLERLRALCTSSVRVEDAPLRTGPVAALDDYLQATRAWGLHQQRRWCHLRPRAVESGVESESFAMLIVAWPNGSNAFAWCGRSRDRLVCEAGQWRFAERRFLDWSGEVLARFPRYAPAR